jgi:hypothetical protein
VVERLLQQASRIVKVGDGREQGGTWSKIAVIGCPGAGKTTLARELGRVTGLPVYHLDDRYWREGWHRPPEQEWVALVQRLAEEPVWIIDGHYAATIEARLDAADAVVFVDAPWYTCAARVIRRVVEIRRGDRDQLPRQVREAIGPVAAAGELRQLLWKVVRFPLEKHRTLVPMLRSLPAKTAVIRISGNGVIGGYDRVQPMSREPARSMKGRDRARSTMTLIRFSHRSLPSCRLEKARRP